MLKIDSTFCFVCCWSRNADVSNKLSKMKYIHAFREILFQCLNREFCFAQKICSNYRCSQKWKFVFIGKRTIGLILNKTCKAKKLFKCQKCQTISTIKMFLCLFNLPHIFSISSFFLNYFPFSRFSPYFFRLCNYENLEEWLSIFFRSGSRRILLRTLRIRKRTNLD